MVVIGRADDHCIEVSLLEQLAVIAVHFPLGLVLRRSCRRLAGVCVADRADATADGYVSQQLIATLSHADDSQDDSIVGSEAVVIGDRRKYLTALVTLNPEMADAFATEHGIGGPLHQADAIKADIQATVDAMNAKLARVEQVKRFTILPRELTIEDGELTGTLKVKRNVVNDHFADTIDSMYSGDGA